MSNGVKPSTHLQHSCVTVTPFRELSVNVDRIKRCYVRRFVLNVASSIPGFRLGHCNGCVKFEFNDIK